MTQALNEHAVAVGSRDKASRAPKRAGMRVPNRTAKNHLKKLTGLGLLRMFGAGRATRYEVVRP